MENLTPSDKYYKLHLNSCKKYYEKNKSAIIQRITAKKNEKKRTEILDKLNNNYGKFRKSSYERYAIQYDPETQKYY